MAKVSAGLLMVRQCTHGPEFLLIHPGGPFFRRRDMGVWSIPKGQVCPGEALLTAAKREFGEETGLSPTTPTYEPLGKVRQRSGKIVHAWAFLGDCDPGQVRSNLFELEWPPRSGRIQHFPEVDRAGFFAAEWARRKLNPAQAAFIDRALAWLRRLDRSALAAPDLAAAMDEPGREGGQQSRSPSRSPSGPPTGAPTGAPSRRPRRRRRDD